MDERFEGHIDSEPKSEEEISFDSLKDVEFAGDSETFQIPGEKLENNIENSPEDSSEREHETEPSLDAIVEKLRAPFNEDEAIRVANTDRRCKIQSRIDSRTEASTALAETRAQLEAEKENLAKAEAEERSKLSFKIRSKLGMRNKKFASFHQQKMDIEGRLAIMTNDEYELRQQNDADLREMAYAERTKDYSERIKPLSVEEKVELLKPEALSELSTEEYLALWRRLNPFYASHVTRQGVRDHNSMFYHSAGMGEFTAGFTEMLKADKTIYAPSEVHYGIGEGFTEEDVKKCIDSRIEDRPDAFDEAVNSDKSPEEAAKQYINTLPMNTTMASADAWADIHAIHFARNTALNETYGAENGNEVFYVFPIDVIASQSQFGGHIGRDFSTAQVVSERKWNDLFVWPESGRIPLDSGIVFLPKSVEVSPETGSIYETVESVGPNGEIIREPFLDEEIVQNLDRAVQTLESEGYFEENSQKLYAELYNKDAREALVDRLKTEFNLDDKIVEQLLDQQQVFLRPKKDYAEDLLFKALAEKDGFNLSELKEDEKYRLSMRYFMEITPLGLQKVKEPVSAEAYWTKYFEEHPEERPKHVIFYDGDPSSAVADMMEEHGIGTRRYGDELSDIIPNMEGPGDTHETDGDWLGYDDHLLLDPTKDERMNAEHARFNEIASRYVAQKIREKRGESSQN